MAGEDRHAARNTKFSANGPHKDDTSRRTSNDRTARHGREDRTVWCSSKDDAACQRCKARAACRTKHSTTVLRPGQVPQAAPAARRYRPPGGGYFGLFRPIIVRPDILSWHGARVSHCLTSAQQEGQQETPVDWPFVSPVSLVSAIFKLLDRIKNGRCGRHREQKVGNRPQR